MKHFFFFFVTLCFRISTNFAFFKLSSFFWILCQTEKVLLVTQTKRKLKTNEELYLSRFLRSEEILDYIKCMNYSNYKYEQHLSANSTENK